MEAELLLLSCRTQMGVAAVRRCCEILADDRNFDWGVFLDHAARHRVLPLVARNFDRYSVHPVGSVHRQLLRAAYLFNARRNQALTAELRHILFQLNLCGVPVVMRKGAYLAEHLYPEPGIRGMSDIDLYVRSGDRDRFAAAMTELGYAQGNLSPDRRVVVPLSRSAAIFWKLHVATLPLFLRPTSDPYVEVSAVDARLDMFEPASGKSLPADHLLERSHPATVAGERTRALSVDDLVVDVATHLHREATTLAAIEAGKDLCLYRFVDLAELWRRHGRGMDRERFVALVRRYGIADEVYFALHFTELLFGGMDPALLAALRPPDLSYLDAYGELDRQPAAWHEPFLVRLFDRNRAGKMRGRSQLPRLEPYPADARATGATAAAQRGE